MARREQVGENGERGMARSFAVHEAQEREHALLELKEATEHALDPA
jgi:hypothetical protein